MTKMQIIILFGVLPMYVICMYIKNGDVRIVPYHQATPLVSVNDHDSV